MDDYDDDNDYTEDYYSEEDEVTDLNLEDDKNNETDTNFQLLTYKNVLEGIEKKQKNTIPYLTKFEKARIIGTRLQQLAYGAKPCIDITEFAQMGDKNMKEKLIAEKELEMRKTPFIIRRILPNGTYEDWKMEEFLSVK